jgi:hypothetical protein
VENRVDMAALMRDLGVRIADLDSFVFDAEWTSVYFIV